MDHLFTGRQLPRDSWKYVEFPSSRAQSAMHLWFITSISLVSVDVQVAKKHGYTKLVLGVCSSRIAARAVAATAKVSIFLLQ